MSIRPIRCEEINAFATFSDQPEKNSKFLTYLTQMCESGYMRPEWCFVAEEAEEFIGRVAYWTLPSQDNYFEVDFIEVPWSANNYLEVGIQLLQESLRLLHLPAHTVILHTYDEPYPVSTFSSSNSAAQRIKLLEHFGFSLAKQTYRFELQFPTTEIKPPERLIFRSLDDISEDAFIDAILQVSYSSLDRAIQQEIEELGELQFARRYFNTMKAFNYKPIWWQLAYNQTGELVGLIMPARNDSAAIIGYIGVVPKYRGQGYVNDLLAQGALTLMADNATHVRADADVHNTPMVDAFLSAGYRRFALRREYRKHKDL